jgi:hypothetical protein
MDRALADIRTIPLPLLLATGALSLALAALAASSPGLALALPLTVPVVFLLVRTHPRYVVAALLAYLPFQDLVVSRLGGAPVLAARYLPELAVYVVVAALVLRVPARRVLDRLGPLTIPLGLVVAFWLLTAVWNATSPSTALIGFRSELRFLPLLLVPLLTTTLGRDLRLYGRTLLAVGAFQSLLAVAQVVGGRPVRELFAPQYELIVGGLTAGLAGPDLDTIFGTFAHRNGLGIFLALVWTLYAAAGSRWFGLSPRSGLALGSLLVLGAFLSGSRAGGVMLIVSAILVGRIRFRWPLGRVALLGAIAVAVTGFFLAPYQERATIDDRGERLVFLHPSSPLDRWRTVFTREAWSATYYTNFRLYYLAESAGLVAERSPVFGFGIGSVSDPRRIADGTTPAALTLAGQRAIDEGFVWDGGWTLLLMEVGYGGLAALALLFLVLYRLGGSIARAHWTGLALMSLVASVTLLGFLAPIFQQRLPMAIFWLVAGAAAAVAADRRAAGAAGPAPEAEPRRA